jgi:hypothetical protein
MLQEGKMELSAYPRHRVRLFRGNSIGAASTVFNSGLTNSSVLSDLNSVKQAMPATSLGDLADQIFAQRPPVTEIKNVASQDRQVQDYAERLNLLLKLNATLSDGSSPIRPIRGYRTKVLEHLSTKRFVVKHRGSHSRGSQPSVGYSTKYFSNEQGHKVYAYSDGAVVTKDELGRVIEVTSSANKQMFITYSNAGFLSIFCLLDACGNVLLMGQHTENGVDVRGSSGDLRVTGDYMSVGPDGCLTIHKTDGEFLSLDLVLNTYTERRCIVDREMQTHCLTAVFSEDGFRMMTRFQLIPNKVSVVSDSSSGSSNWQGNTGQMQLRFYGRDHSIIEFDSDEEVESMRPSLVLPLNQQHLHKFKSNRNGIQAWDSVERYLNFASQRT